MALFILRRLLSLIPFVLLTSITVFVLITLPPGDFMTSYAAQLATAGESFDAASLENLRQRYGLGEPFYVQYWKWISGVVVGDFGYSFEWQQPVNTLIGERLALTVLLSFAALLFTWGLAIPIGIFSAVRKNTFGDYVVTLVGFVGLATLSPGDPAHVRLGGAVRAVGGGPLLARDGKRALVLRQGRGPLQPPLDPDHRDRHVG